MNLNSQMIDGSLMNSQLDIPSSNSNMNLNMMSRLPMRQTQRF